MNTYELKKSKLDLTLFEEPDFESSFLHDLFLGQIKLALDVIEGMDVANLSQKDRLKYESL
jgi:hypothetical protein